jgi:hypothetical protein
MEIMNKKAKNSPLVNKNEMLPENLKHLELNPRENKADFLQSEKFRNLVFSDGLLNIYFDCKDFEHCRKIKQKNI